VIRGAKYKAARASALAPPSRGETLSERLAARSFIAAITRPRLHSRAASPLPPDASFPLIPITAIPSRRDARQSRRATRSASYTYILPASKLPVFPIGILLSIIKPSVAMHARIAHAHGCEPPSVTYNLLKCHNLRRARRCSSNRPASSSAIPAAAVISINYRGDPRDRLIRNCLAGDREDLFSV